MLKLMRKILILAALCSAFIAVPTPGVKVKAQMNNCAACFAACDQERTSCFEWGMGCPYPNENEFYPSESYWFRVGPITCSGYYYGDCETAYRNCSADCFNFCV